jgi:hypothetical protein
MEITKDKYWDCNCEENYIKGKEIFTCDVCRAVQEDQPDSIQTEVDAMLYKKAHASTLFQDAIKSLDAVFEFLDNDDVVPEKQLKGKELEAYYAVLDLCEAIYELEHAGE